MKATVFLGVFLISLIASGKESERVVRTYDGRAEIGPVGRKPDVTCFWSAVRGIWICNPIREKRK